MRQAVRRPAVAPNAALGVVGGALSALGALLAAGATACAGGGVTLRPNGALAGSAPAARLERALLAAGGVAALDRARVLAWDGEATVTAGGRTARIAGTWTVQPPDTAVVTTYDVTRGPAASRSLVVAAPHGWIVLPTRTFAMPPALLASERDQFSLYDAMRLLPLRAPGVRLDDVEPDSAGHHGFRARRPGRPDVDLWFDAGGRLAHVAAMVANAEGGAPVRHDLWLDGELRAGGVRWPRRIRIARSGAPYFDLTLRALRVLPRLDRPLPAPPAPPAARSGG